MKKILYTLFGLLLSLSLFSQKKNSDKPNVIIIYIDDMGYGDLEPYGMTGIRTPNFNKLAAQGARFTNFESAQPICTASRTALLTGCYPNRIGMSGVLLPWDKYALNPKETTIASMLKNNGYKTALVGKWHLGNTAPYLPLSYGFDQFYGIKYSHDIWPVDYDGHSIVTDEKDMRSKFPQLEIYEGNTPVETIKNIDEAGKLTTIFTERAVKYIKENKKAPFFLYLAHPLPHAPLAVSDKFKGKSKSGLFGDVIMELDWSLGQIMETLKKENLEENTLIIVASDNGPWLKFGNHAGSSGGLREGKSTTFEGGNRVPFFIKWPGHIPVGDINGELFTNMDILPTIAAVTGAKLPENKIDGINYLPFLTGKVQDTPREVMYYYFGINANYLEAIRYKNWKLVFPHDYMSYAGSQGRDGVPGKQTKKTAVLALYDLAHDPGETYDVATLYPEIMKKMTDYAQEARADLGDDLTGKAPVNVRPHANYN